MNSSVKMDSCSMNAALAPVDTSFGEVERGEVEGQEVAPQIEGRVPDNAPVFKGYGMGYSAAQWVMKYTKNHPYLCFVCVGLFGGLRYGFLGSSNDVSSTGITNYTNKDLEFLHGNFDGIIESFRDKNNLLNGLKHYVGIASKKAMAFKNEVNLQIEKDDTLSKDNDFIKLMDAFDKIMQKFNQISQFVDKIPLWGINPKIIKDDFVDCLSQVEKKSCYERLNRVVVDFEYKRDEMALSPLKERLDSLSEEFQDLKDEINHYLYDS